jgi:uncharacterized membrane protein
MRSHRSRTGSWFALVSAGLLVAVITGSPAYAQSPPGSRAPCVPRIIDLGTLGGANSEIDGANRLGTWVGSAEDSNGVSIPVLWHGGTIQTLGESDGFAADITNAGVVVGTADVDSASSHAFWWYRGTPHLLPVPSWATSSYVRRINQHDDAVGALYTTDGASVPVEWRHLQAVRVLPLPRGASSGEALGINDAGDIVGDVSTDTAELAWEWGQDGSSHALLPRYAQGGFSQANLINDRGWAAGGLDFGGQFGLWAAVWRRGPAEKLGQFGPDPNFSFALGQDQLGDYVGGATYTIDDPFLHVFITRTGSGTIQTMLPLSGDLADRSNAHAAVPTYQGPGVAVGGASATSNGDYHATVWTCAFQQAFTPDVAAATTRARTSAPSWRRLLDVHR